MRKRAFHLEITIITAIYLQNRFRGLPHNPKTKHEIKWKVNFHHKRTLLCVEGILFPDPVHKSRFIPILGTRQTASACT